MTAMQGLELGTTDIGATQTLQGPAPSRESDSARPADPAEPGETAESFRAAWHNQMSAETAASSQSKAQQSARETAAQSANTQANGGQKTTDTAAVVGPQVQVGQVKAGSEIAPSKAAPGAVGQATPSLTGASDLAAKAKAAGQVEAQAGAANLVAKSDADVAARAEAATRGTANSAAGGKTIASGKAKPAVEAGQAGDALTAKADAVSVTAVPAVTVPVIVIAAPVLAVQPKPANDAGQDANGAGAAAVGTKRARRVAANQLEAGAAKTASAKTAQADSVDAGVDAGAGAGASKDAKFAAAAEAIAATVVAQAGPHTIAHPGNADALTGIAAQGLGGGAAAGSIGGGHTRENAIAANGGVVSGGPEAGLPGHQILSAGPTQLEVGVMDGTHGWLQIRAELGTGGTISTSLTGSAAAHAPLQQAVPEMTSYLASESVSVSGIAVHKASETAGTMAWGQGPSEGQAAGSGGRGGSPNHDGGAVMDGARAGQSSRGDSSQQTGVTPIGLGWMGGVSPAVFASGFSNGTSLATGTGSWLSVRV